MSSFNQISNSKKDKISLFLSGTDTSDKKKAKEILTKLNWDVEKAILKYIEENSKSTSNPFNFIKNAFSNLFNSLKNIFFIDPKEANNQTISDFNKKFNPKLKFAPKTFLEANKLSKERKKLLYILIYNPQNHNASLDYCKNVLSNDFIVDFLNTNFICWITKSNSKIGKELTNLPKCKKFPVTMVFAPSRSVYGHKIIHFEGNININNLMNMLIEHVSSYNSIIHNQINQEKSNKEYNNLRKQQDDDFSRAVMADKQKLEKEKEEQRKQKEYLLSEQKRKSEEKKYLEKLKNCIKDEPNEEEKKDIVRFSISFSDGSLKQRNFLSSDQISNLYNYVEYEIYKTKGTLLNKNFLIITTFPRKIFKNTEKTFFELGFRDRAKVMVENLK